jgi:Rrf2 family protein
MVHVNRLKNLAHNKVLSVICSTFVPQFQTIYHSLRNFIMISQKTKYAIKALIYLAQQENKQIVRTAEIAEHAHIPRKFLEGILVDLKRGQVVSSKQGVNGGYYLLKNKSDISLADIHRLFDGAVALLPCASDNFYEPCKDCPNEAQCRLRWALQEIKHQTLKAMDHISIDTLASEDIL